MKFQDWMNNHIRFENGDYKIAQNIKCNDGFSMSVQASVGHYCSPRSQQSDYCEYNTFEVGYPSERVEDFMEYAEDRFNPTGTVYGWVPVDVIQSVIDQHGGIQ